MDTACVVEKAGGYKQKSLAIARVTRDRSVSMKATMVEIYAHPETLP